MKNWLLAACLIILSFSLKAQTNTEEITMVQSIYGMDKKELIAKHMKLNATQAPVFWQLYDEYEIQRKEIGQKRANNIITYAEKYETMTNDNADLLIKTSFEINSSFVKLWEQTYKKMAKSLSPVVAAQFIQAEMFIENMIRQELSLDIPLIGELEIKK
jgi:hypothetical protein